MTFSGDNQELPERFPMQPAVVNLLSRGLDSMISIGPCQPPWFWALEGAKQPWGCRRAFSPHLQVSQCPGSVPQPDSAMPVLCWVLALSSLVRGLCLLSDSFRDICSCSACSGFVRTKIITQRMGGGKKGVCVHMFRKAFWSAPQDCAVL